MKINDIDKTSVSSLKKGITTNRNLNPLMPKYDYLKWTNPIYPIDSLIKIYHNDYMMNHLTHERTKAAFQTVGLSDKDYVDVFALRDALEKLSGEEFDEDILEQLWEQCRLNSQGKTKVGSFLDNAIRAESILVQKEKDISGISWFMEMRLLWLRTKWAGISIPMRRLN